MIGLRVGPFEIVEPAVVPEPGEWFYARRSGMSQRRPAEVLVRVLPPDAGPEARVELQKQFENLRQVEHARVPIAVAMYEGVGAMAITAVRGTSLSNAVAARAEDDLAMSPPTLLDLLLDVAEILQFAHHRGRPHGSLDPSKLVLSPDGTLWVMGFAAGLSTPCDPEWTPPERARGEPATEATDQWALAALASALITGRPPWPGADPLTEASKGAPDAMVEPVERQWPALARALRKMLDHRPANRYATMHQVRQELLALARRAGGTSSKRELAVDLNDVELPVVEVELVDEVEAEAEPPTPKLGDTLTPADATGEADTAEVAETAPLQAPRAAAGARARAAAGARARAAAEPEPAGDPPSDPIQVARTVEGAARRDRKATPLPAEQIPVVRPEEGEVPDAGRGITPAPRIARPPEPVPSREQALVENTGPTMLADVKALAAAHGLEASSFGRESDADDDEINVSPHPEHDPKSVSDPPSVANLSAELEDEPYDDEEATVVFQPHLANEELADMIAAYRSDIPAAPTLTPDTDSEHASEELPSPRPAPVPTHPGAGDPHSIGLPKHLPSSIGHEPELGNMHEQLDLSNEPGLAGPDDDDLPHSDVAPQEQGDIAKTLAFGAIALMFLVFLAYLAIRFT